MKNSLKIYIAILVLLMAAVVVFEVSQPRPVDWTPTFNESQTKPYALKVLHTELQDAFEDGVEDIRTSPYEYLQATLPYMDTIYSRGPDFVYVDSHFNLDETSVTELLKYVEAGNTAFISSHNFPVVLADTLGLETSYNYAFNQKGSLNLANPELQKDSISVKESTTGMFFSALDSLNTTVLGYQDFKERQINFVSVRFGKGTFLLHTYPYAFTNYYLLKDRNMEYAAGVFSYLPSGKLYFKAKDRQSAVLGNSPLRFINSQPPLRWAWLTGLVTLLVFILFNAKRKQRIIRVIPPVPNTTVDFVKTISNLYYETGDHANLIEKKITYFLEGIRNRYYVDTTQLNEKFVRTLAAKTGKEKKVIAHTVKLISRLAGRTTYTEQDLLRLNRAIEQFHANNNTR
ncbi:DUF4350 domain-containing protein [Sinomicrobium soli]|uniref:DUF4350 domain-containing protein n=1 Tax=Sinomicrobium sp. N-1-3-6 TaxID=2219864 RepID=UPI000DCD0CB5|nr:DUF4350 domain-containing protein [Sinomicrobium sp. N-1-3-6]RAV29804.1 DUF4350 domain-containing protein [Sinomicrobium sp. N-1-3-6]